MYHIPKHLSGYGAYGDEDYSDHGNQSHGPMGLQLPGIAGYGTLSLPATSGYGAFGTPPTLIQASPPPAPGGGPVDGSGKAVVELGTGTKVLFLGLGALVLGGIAYMFYREMQLRSEIVKSGGGRALAEYELAKAAGTVAGGLFSAPERARENRRKRGRRRRKG